MAQVSRRSSVAWLGAFQVGRGQVEERADRLQWPALQGLGQLWPEPVQVPVRKLQRRRPRPLVFNVVVEVDVQPSAGQGVVGIDLGLKDVATCSDGVKLENGRFYRDLEDKLAIAQRARSKRRVKAFHARIKNRRKDALHKFSRRLVDQHGEIVVGDVSPTKLAKTSMAKSVLDAGWGQLKTMLKYKCDHAGIVFREVSEAYTTRTCSSCGSLSGPHGVNGLRVRAWESAECGALHDRDTNAARNILSLGAGRCPPAVGITFL